MEQLKSIGRELAMGSHGGSSKEFLDLVKSIGESRSKSEEDRIILRELETLRRRLSEPDIPRKKMKEYLLRLAYAEMLGHDASFGYIHAVKMAHDDNISLKRTGYLTVALFLDDGHDLIILIVNTIQKDLRSDNYLVVCAALVAVCRLINEETIPAVLPQVVELLGHQKEAVRKKAVMALHRFYQKSPSSVSHLVSDFRKRLCDNDPGVMGATLCPLFDLISEDANAYKDLVTSLVGILKQVAEKKLPTSYDYHHMPAPFIQIKLLKILALLGSGDKQASANMYSVLSEIFRKCESSSNIGNAILYECICCVSSIYPNSKLLGAAVEATSKFLKSESHNLKYMGIDALGRLIRINPDIAEEHQLAVIDCLEDPDDTLKRKTFELLYKMTKSTNVEVIVDRMIEYMINITDSHYKTEIASRCVELAEQFAPSNQWFIQTMNKVFEHAGDLVNSRVAHNLMRLIAEGFGEDDEGADSQLRSSAVDSYLRILGEPKLPSLFLQVICWVLGEYGTADGKYSASYIIGKLCDVAEAHSTDDTVKAYAVSAIMKVCAFEVAAGRNVDMLPECQALIDELSASHSTDLQQRAYELQALLSLDRQAIETVLPPDASCEDIEIDASLSFLTNYINQAIENGARPYISESERLGTSNTITSTRASQYQHDTSASHHSLRFEAYELPTKPPAVQSSVPSFPTGTGSTDLVPVSEPSFSENPNPRSQTLAEQISAETAVRLRLDGVQKKWGRPTYSSPSAPSTSSSAAQKPTNGVATGGEVQVSSARKQQQQVPEVSAEKQKLAASLFGSAASKKGARRMAKESQSHVATSAPEPVKEKPVALVAPAVPPPDLLDLGEPSQTDQISQTSVVTVDPFMQLEGLMGPSVGGSEPGQTGPSVSAAKTDDLLSVFTETPLVIDGKGSTKGVKKGPNLQDALQKDATTRQVGVTPTGNNPNLFKDLLG
ncbi:hypothetical protein LUZ60_002108 [Juncus effusus]|nr:hypothetical protein LUZ60_002108 [Juncus effusus]